MATHMTPFGTTGQPDHRPTQLGFCGTCGTDFHLTLPVSLRYLPGEFQAACSVVIVYTHRHNLAQIRHCQGNRSVRPALRRSGPK
jgi:hypothetical protein